MRPEMRELLVRRDALADAHIKTSPIPPPAAGEVLLAIDKFALTANNVTYAVTGDLIGYWRFFPAEAPWGKVPVWGFADVIASAHPAITVGERLYGFFPMASHLLMQPGNITSRGFDDVAPHRSGLPPIYNNYARTSNDRPELRALENERALFFPLFVTSFLLYDYLVDNDWFGVDQVIVISASSKTALGLANLLANHEAPHPQIVGVTSPANVAFVTALGTYNTVTTYDTIAALNRTTPTALVDMSGNGDIITQLHHHFGENIKVSISVGATHWQAGRAPGAALPGARPTFFFAPSQIAKRDTDWGPGEVLRRATAASARIAIETKPHIHITTATNPEAVKTAFERAVAGKVPPDEALILSLRSD